MLKNKTMVLLLDDYNPPKHTQSLTLRAVNVVTLRSQCVKMSFLQNQCLFIVKAYYESRSYKFICEQFIAEFPDWGLPTKLSIKHPIQKFETTRNVLNALYRRARSTLTWAFSNLVHYVDCCLINERSFEFLM